MKVGDKINVTLKGVVLGGALTVPRDQPMTVQGTIVEDYDDQWLVELSISVGEKNRNRMLIPKSSIKIPA